VKAFPPRFLEGVRHFNAGRYFEAHEAFEESLDDLESDARWDLALALVQVAVGYHKWTSGHAGAARMLRLGDEKLARFPADAWGIDVGGLRRASRPGCCPSATARRVDQIRPARATSSGSTRRPAYRNAGITWRPNSSIERITASGAMSCGCMRQRSWSQPASR
jgi:uncharacterized protein